VPPRRRRRIAVAWTRDRGRAVAERIGTLAHSGHAWSAVSRVGRHTGFSPARAKNRDDLVADLGRVRGVDPGPTPSCRQ
jgi:hypothetical protein